MDKKAVRPDALFRLNAQCFFLEVERAKLGDYKDGRPSITRKLEAYRDYYDSTDCEKDFGFRKFRVVTIMRTKQRVENLTAACVAAGMASGIFLNACENAFFDFTTPKPGYTPSFQSLTSE